MARIDAIRRLEEHSLHGLPSLETEHHDGWILRASRGYTRRANAAMPVDAGQLSVDGKLTHLEDWYRNRGLTPVLRLTPASRPDRLDQALERRGYLLGDGEVSVQECTLGDTRPPSGPVDLATGSVPERWLATLAGLQERVASNMATVAELFRRLPPTSAFATAVRDGEHAAIGRAVVVDGRVGLFDVLTNPQHRRRGLAGDVTRALLGWGVEHGATHAWLQVHTANRPARRLYRRFGFAEVYRYWYRIGRSSGPTNGP